MPTINTASLSELVTRLEELYCEVEINSLLCGECIEDPIFIKLFNSVSSIITNDLDNIFIFNKDKNYNYWDINHVGIHQIEDRIKLKLEAIINKLKEKDQDVNNNINIYENLLRVLNSHIVNLGIYVIKDNEFEDMIIERRDREREKYEREQEERFEREEEEIEIDKNLIKNIKNINLYNNYSYNLARSYANNNKVGVGNYNSSF